MENPSDSGSSHIIKITHLGKKVKRQTHSSEQNFSNAFNKHQKKRDILQEAQNHHMLKYVQGKDISEITPHGQSYQNSPVHFNILAELGASTTPIKQMPGLFEDSESFGVHFDNDVVESTNLNSKIAQILTDSKSELDIKDPAGKVDLSFSVRTEDYSVDLNDNTETHRLKRSRREKVPSRVTIDESLNTDLMYDPNISATAQQGKNEKKNKPDPKKDVINVYTRNSPKRVEQIKEIGNMTPEGKISRKISANLEYKPTKTEEDEHQLEKLYHGVTTPEAKNIERESRWSKLEEDQVAKLFQERKANLFEGLKKLNKTKTVAVSTKSSNIIGSKHMLIFKDQPSPKRSARQGGDVKKDAVKLDTWSEGNSIQSKVVDLRTGKVVKKRASSNQRSTKRTSVTPKKSESNRNRFNPPKSLSVDLKLRSRSLSNDDPKPIEQFLKSYSSNRPPADKTQMIDEIYKQAKEDVQKRIANIERKLLENESDYHQKSGSTKSSATIKSEPKILTVSSPQSQNQTPTPSGNQRKISAEASLESSKKPNSRPRSPETMEAYRPRQEQQSPEKMMVISPTKATRTPSSNKATPVKVTFVSPQGAQNVQRNITFNVAPPVETEKVSIKRVNRVERGSSKEPVANNGNKRPQQAIQAPNSPEAYFSLRQATGGNESKRGNTPNKMANSTPTKFSDIEQASLQRNSYSKIHADRAVRAFASPQARDNQIPLEDSVANFLMLEKTLKAQIAKEAASGSKRKPPSHGSPVKPQNVRPASKEQDNYRTNARREDSQQKDRKNINAEVKQFTLRPQSTEKTPVKRGNPASQSDGFKRAAATAEKSTPDKTTQLRKASKEPKPHANTATNFFSADQCQDSNKIPRSSSDQKIKAMAFTKSPKAVLNRVLQTDYNRPQMIDNSNEASLISTKSVSTIGRQPIIPNKSEIVRREKPVRALASPEIHKSSKTTVSEADESLSSKNDYLKSLFVKQKVTPAVEKKSPPQVNRESQKPQQQRQQKVEENLVYATSSDDLEELLKQNYRFLEIRNNQYVFTNSS